ncbi:MAG: hypothetical protein CMJ59_17940 [Planctomycetaceae bacterium]|nr:hypothetical protein [Planctomycetaceae bacterium]
MKRLLWSAIICLATADGFAEEPLARWQTTVDFGDDLGQNFGSLFEARDGQGRLVAGAGFQEVYNTRFRSNRHSLQFFIRPARKAETFHIERLPHPDLDCGIYLFELDGQLHAWTGARSNRVKRWDPKRRRWESDLQVAGGLGSGDGVMRIGRGLLVFKNSAATFTDAFDGTQRRTILAPPAVGRYYNFYYALGRLFFYHTSSQPPEAFTRIHACRWDPATAVPIDLSQSVVQQAVYVGETPFSWGQFQGEVVTVTNQGGIHACDGRRWRTLQEADNRVNYQVYSMLNFYDRTLLAQYPTGHLFEYRGGTEVRHLDGWPPRLRGVSSRAREAQTTAIYRGEMFTGVWPWAELWRYDRDVDRWHSMGRAFSHPAVTDKTVHPYQEHADRFRLVSNHWGQRITSMIPIGDALYLSTSAKGTYEWNDDYDFLTDEQRREYGAALRLTMPGNLTTLMRWTDQPVALEFLVFTDRLVVRQDGREIGSSRFQVEDKTRVSDTKTTWGRGIFGPLNGRLLRHIAP